MKKDIELEKPICIREVNDNIRNCELGLPLTKPLKILNQFCQFREKFEEMDKIIHEGEIIKEVKARHKEYFQKPGVKAKHKEYYKKYFQRPEVKAKMKEYYQRPEVKAKMKEYYKKYYQKRKNEPNN